VDHLTPLERAAVAAGQSLASGTFGESMRRAHPGRRSAKDNRALGLSTFELNAGPPIYRTLVVLDAAARSRKPLELNEDDRRHVDWVGDVHSFLRAISHRFWADVRPDVRLLIFDHDNRFLLHSGPTYIPGLRDRPGPSLATSAARIGVDASQELAALAGCWHAAHRTNAYEAARLAGLEIRSNDSLRRSLAARRTELEGRVDEEFREGRRLGEIAASLRQLRAEAYDGLGIDVRNAAEAIRAYHELVQAVIWVVLGFAEQAPDKQSMLAGGLPRVSVRHRWRSLEAQFTTAEGDTLGVPGIGAPFLVTGRGLLDGVYLCVAFSMFAMTDTATFDVTGQLLRELELAPRLA
jgi:hypothetical protein